MKKYKIIYLALLIFVNSCSITQEMWRPFYEERINKFLISQDGRNIVFLSKNYHYILDDDTDLVKRLLFSPQRSLFLIQAEESKIILSKNNNIEAQISIISAIRGILIPEVERDFLNLGFKYSDLNEMRLKIKLKGRRYKASQDFIYNQLGSLNNAYLIKVYEPISFFGKVERAAVTPITLMLDTTILIGKIALFPFAD